LATQQFRDWWQQPVSLSPSQRAKAYADMESLLGDVVRMGEIAAMMFDEDQGLFVFATTHLDEMLQDFRRRYYAMDFPL
jgi:hypothetical protein